MTAAVARGLAPALALAALLGTALAPAASAAPAVGAGSSAVVSSPVPSRASSSVSADPSTGVASATPGTPAGAVRPTAVGAEQVVVEITSITPQVLRPGEDLTVRATLRNTGTTPVAEPAAALRVNRFRMSTREEVQAWAALGPDGPVGGPGVAEAAAEQLAPGASVSVVLTLPADDVGLLDTPGVWGPRGLAVEVLSAGTRVGVQRSYVLWNPDQDVPQVGISVLLPVVGPASAGDLADPATGGDEAAGDDGSGRETDAPAADETGVDVADAEADAALVADIDQETDQVLDRLTRDGGRLDDLATAAQADATVGLAVDPALVARAREGSTEARAWAERLDALMVHHPTYALPWSDPDPAAVAHAGRPELLTVASGLATSSEELGERRPVLLWAPDSRPADGTTLSTTAAAGAAAFVSSSADDDPATTTARVAAATAAGSVDLLTPDAALTTLLTDLDAGPVGSTTATVVQQALAELALVARELSGPSVLVAPPRLATFDPTVLAAFASATSTTPWTRLEPVTEVLDDTSADVATIPPASTVSDRELAPAQVGALADARAEAATFSAVTSDPEAALARVDVQVLAPIAVAWRGDPDGRAELVDATVRDIERRTVGLSIAPVSDINVISAASDVRFSVQNDLDVAATVRLLVEPRKACLEAAPTDLVTVDAQASQSVTVDLTAHANCDVVVDLQLVTPAGDAIGEPESFTARVSPTIESVGATVVAVLLAIGFVLGIARTVRRGQSARRGARTVAEAEAEAPTTLPVLGGSAPPAADDTAGAAGAAGADGPPGFDGPDRAEARDELAGGAGAARDGATEPGPGR